MYMTISNLKGGEKNFTTTKPNIPKTCLHSYEFDR